MKKILTLVILILLIFLFSAPAMASDITGAHWRGIIRISNTGTAASYVTTNFTVNTTAMISNGYMSDGTDVVIQSSGVDVPFMPGYGTSTWFMFVNSIGAGQNLNYEIFTDNVTGGKLAYFPGATGFTVPDAPEMDGLNNFSIKINCFIDTTSVNQTIILKTGGFNLYIGSSSGNITAWLVGPPQLFVSVAGIASGEYLVHAHADTVNFYLDLNGVNVATSALGGSFITDTAGDWQAGSTATTYILSANITAAGVLGGRWESLYGATFTDLSGNGNTATPQTYRTTSSDADVTADLLSLYPVTESEYLAAASLAAATGIVLGTPDTPIELYTDEDYSKIPGANAINAMIDASGTSATDRIPRVMWWFPMIYGIIAVAGMCMYGVTRHEGAQGTLWVPVIVIEVGYIIAGLLNPIGFFGAILFLLPALTCLTADKHYSMG